MKNFWPQRSNPKGFSIANLTRKYRERISDSSDEISNKLEDRNFKSTIENTKNLDLPELSIKRLHWANRDFSEYRNVA